MREIFGKVSSSSFKITNAGLLLGAALLLAASGCGTRISPARLARVFKPVPRQRPADGALASAGKSSASQARLGSAVQQAARMQLQEAQRAQGAFDPLRDDAKLRSLATAAGADPANALLRMQLASRYEDFGLADAAMDEHLALLELARQSGAALEGPPLLASALLGVARNGLRSGRAEQAVAALEPALAGGESTEIHLQLGLLYDRLGDVSKAESAYRAALRSDPSSAAARNNLGLRLMRRGQLIEAEMQFRAAIATADGSNTARNNLGFLLAARGDMVAAWEQFRAASADSAEAHNHFAVALLNAGKLMESREQLTLALRERRGFPQALSNFQIVQQRIKSGQPARTSAQNANEQSAVVKAVVEPGVTPGVKNVP